MSDTLIAAVDEVRRKIHDLADLIMQDTKMAEMRKLLTGLNTLEDLCGQSKTPISAFFNFGTGPDVGIAIRPDEFYGVEPLEAAKRYLKKKGKAAYLPEIIAAILAGNGDPGPEDKLRVSLARSTVEIAKVGEDYFGLLEFYPHIKRGTPGRKKKNGSGASAEESPTEEKVSDGKETPDVAASGDPTLKGDSK